MSRAARRRPDHDGSWPRPSGSRPRGETAPRPARDPVNQPMINNWLEAMGDTEPALRAQGEAPPAMAQVWTMYGLRPDSATRTTRCTR